MVTVMMVHGDMISNVLILTVMMVTVVLNYLMMVLAVLQLLVLTIHGNVVVAHGAVKFPGQ